MHITCIISGMRSSWIISPHVRSNEKEKNCTLEILTNPPWKHLFVLYGTSSKLARSQWKCPVHVEILILQKISYRFHHSTLQYCSSCTCIEGKTWISTHTQIKRKSKETKLNLDLLTTSKDKLGSWLGDWTEASIRLRGLRQSGDELCNKKARTTKI